MSDRNFTQCFNVVMTSLSSDKKITVQQCYICSEGCDGSLTYLFKQSNSFTRMESNCMFRLGFFFSNKQHFINQTIQFSVAFLKDRKIIVHL